MDLIQRTGIDLITPFVYVALVILTVVLERRRGRKG